MQTLACCLPQCLQAAELEEFLFGASKTNVKELFARRVEESDDDDATLTDLVHKV